MTLPLSRLREGELAEGLSPLNRRKTFTPKHQAPSSPLPQDGRWIEAGPLAADVGIALDGVGSGYFPTIDFRLRLSFPSLKWDDRRSARLHEERAR